MDISEIKKDFEKVPGIEAAVVYGSAARGDSNKNSDIDIAVFVKSIDGVTDRLLYEKLSKFNLGKYDIFLHSDSEVKGIISHIYNPCFYDHFVNNLKIIIDHPNIIQKIKEKDQIWNHVENTIGMDKLFLCNASFRLFKARRKTLHIQHLLLSKDVKSITNLIKSIKANVIGTVREIIGAHNILLSSNDTNINVLNSFFELYPKCLKLKPEIIKIRNLDWDSLSKEEALNAVHSCREIVESSINAFENKIQEMLDHPASDMLK